MSRDKCAGVFYSAASLNQRDAEISQLPNAASDDGQNNTVNEGEGGKKPKMSDDGTASGDHKASNGPGHCLFW